MHKPRVGNIPQLKCRVDSDLARTRPPAPPLYYAVKGVRTHAIASFLVGWVVGALTFGLATFVIGMIYAIMNRNIVRNYYLGKG